jgi:hypothetical protein
MGQKQSSPTGGQRKLPNSQIFPRSFKKSLGSNLGSNSYFRRARTQYLQWLRNWTNPKTRPQKLFNPSCITIYRLHLQKKSKRLGKPLQIFTQPLKNFIVRGLKSQWTPQRPWLFHHSGIMTQMLKLSVYASTIGMDPISITQDYRRRFSSKN